MEQSVLKRRQIKFRSRRITQKKEYKTWTHFLSVNTPLTCSYELHTWFISNTRTNIICTTTRSSHSITQLLAAVAVTPGMLTAGEQLFVTDLCLTPLQASPVSPSATDSCCTVRSKYSFNKTATIVYPRWDLYFLQWYMSNVLVCLQHSFSLPGWQTTASYSQKRSFGYTKTRWKQNTGNKNYILTENMGHCSYGLWKKFKHRSDEEIKHEAYPGYSENYIREELQNRALLMKVLHHSKQFPCHEASVRQCVKCSNQGRTITKIRRHPKILSARGVTWNKISTADPQITSRKSDLAPGICPPLL